VARTLTALISGPLRPVVAVPALLVTASACAASTRGAHQSSESWCGQHLTKPAFMASYGIQTLGPAEAQHGGYIPATSVLPPSIASDSSQLADSSNLLVLTSDCTNGLVVTVTSSPYIRTVGIAHDTGQRGLTALVLGRIKASPGPITVTVTVTGFRDGTIIGQTRLSF
jgi:hypothetical protein